MISLSVISFLNDYEQICLHSSFAIVKESQVLIFNTYNSIQLYSFIFLLLNGSKYCNVLLKIQLNISYLIKHS